MSPARRRPPRPLADSLREAIAAGAPQTLLARVQAGWRETVGAEVAEQAEPVSEREGTVTVACRSATWAQELDLLHDRVLEAVNGALEEGRVERLRFTADAARNDPPDG